MDAPVYKKLIDIQNQMENPFNTKAGQMVVSPSESFWMRLIREGFVVPNNLDQQAITTTGYTTFSSVLTVGNGLGRRLYVKSLRISSNVQAIVRVYLPYVAGFTNPSDAQMNFNYYESYFINANTPLMLNYDGELVLDTTYHLDVMVQAVGSNGLVSINALGVEVTI